MYHHQLSLFVSTYEHDCLLILTAESPARVNVAAYPFDRPMGISVSPLALRLATRQHLLTFHNETPLVTGLESAETTVYRLHSVEPTGFLDAHDVVQTAEDETIVVDTHHSCLRQVSGGRAKAPAWQPDFISTVAPEDRCHLNGVALSEGKPRYVTVVSTSDSAEGWREHRGEGGALIDITSDRLVLTGLSMPHSPRVYREHVWLLNAGTGELGYLRTENGSFQPVAFLPGFLRGLAFHQEHAVVGLSQARRNGKFTGLELQKRLEESKQQPMCGLAVIDIETSALRHQLEFDAPLTELFDVQLVAGLNQPALENCRQRDDLPKTAPD